MIKKLVLFITTIIIISFSFIMPNLLLKIEDLSRENEIFTRPKKENRKIDVEASKIYLVTFIHNIYGIRNGEIYSTDDGKKVEISKSMPITQTKNNIEVSEEFKNEVSKLISNEIINETNLDEYKNYFEISNIFSPEYTITSCSIVKENKEWISLNIEEKTGKIISADFPKSYLRTDVEKEKQLENYSKYLDLDIIDDWKFEENDTLKSEKAQLTIMLVEKDDSCMLTIAPTEVYYEYVAEDEAIKREYKIVESSKKK